MDSASAAGSVDNLPRPRAKVEKLTTVLRKSSARLADPRERSAHAYRRRRQHQGFAFIEFGNAQEAATAAREQTEGYKLDKYIFKVSRFDDFAKYEAVPDTYKTPEPKPYAVRENTQSYMLDERGRHQYAYPIRRIAIEITGTTRRRTNLEVYKRD